MTPDAIGDTMAALHSLGVFKPGEEARTMHAHFCDFRRGACTCPGGPELAYADWDERVPSRGLAIPTPRFHAAR